MNWYRRQASCNAANRFVFQSTQILRHYQRFAWDISYSLTLTHTYWPCLTEVTPRILNFFTKIKKSSFHNIVKLLIRFTSLLQTLATVWDFRCFVSQPHYRYPYNFFSRETKSKTVSLKSSFADCVD